MDYGLEGQVAIVTGGGNGLGKAICQALAAEGCRIAVWDIDLKAARRVADALKKSGTTAIAVAADVTRRADVRKTVAQVRKAFGQIDILVNNAGFSQDAPLVEMTEKQWRSVVDVSLTGSFFMSQAVAPVMIKRRHGRIINMSSRANLGDYMKANYSAAKAGLLGLTGAMALELGVHGITVNAIAPGMIRTERVKALRYYKDIERRTMERTLIKRAGEPEDVANTVLFLASRQASWISSETLYVSGGRFS